MNVAAIILYGLACAFIAVVLMGAAMRPHIIALRDERDRWRELANALQTHDDSGDVTLVDPETGLPWTTDQERDSIAYWLERGMEDKRT